MRLAVLLLLALVLRPAAAAEETDLVLIFDTSGSMNESVRGGRKLDVAKAAMWKFVEMLPKSVNVGLVAFNNGCDVKTVAGIQKASPQARGALKTAVSGLPAEGSTPIGYALEAATKMLAGTSGKKRIVVMTDGEETCDDSALARASDAAWKQGVKIYAVGFAFGSTPSRNFRRIGVYKDANDDAQLASVFADIRKSLERETGKYDEARKDPALADTPGTSLAGRSGRFKPSGSHRVGKLFTDLKLNSCYEHRFTEADRFKVLEHGFHVMFNEEEFSVDKVEVLKVRLEEKLNFTFGGVEGFVLASDVTIE